MKNLPALHFIGKCLITFLLLFTGWFNSSNAQSYCTTGLYYYGCNWGSSAINDFRLADLQQTATGCGGELSDYTSLTIHLAAGENYMFQLTSSTSPMYYIPREYSAIWIDLNDNGSFEDAGELLFSSPTYWELSGTISIPLSAPLGDHRMRVRLKYDDYMVPFALDNSCTTFYLGEAHDYTVNIAAAPSCTNPSSLSVASITTTSAVVNWGCNSCSGTFLVEYGPAGFTPGTDGNAGTNGTLISNATAPLALNGLSSDTRYDVYVRRYCGGSDYSQNLGPLAFTTRYDYCATISPISCGNVIHANIPPGNGGIGDGTGKELIYSFMADQSGLYTITIVNTDYNQVGYAIKDATAGCNETGWEYFIQYYSNYAGTFPLDTLVAGHTYYIMLDARYPGNGGVNDFRIDCYTPSLPCNNIPAISCGTAVTAVTDIGVGSFNTTNNFYLQGREKVYRFVPTVTGTYTLTVDGTSGTWDLAGFFYKKASDGCENDNWHFIDNNGGFYTPRTSLIGNLAAGVEYYFMMDAFWFNSITRTFRIDCYQPNQPCNSIENISCGTNITCTIDPGIGIWQPTTCISYGGHSQVLAGREKVYRFIPSTSGYSLLHVSMYDYDKNMKFFIKPESEGCSAQGWQCISIFNAYQYQMIPLYLQEGQSYLILVDAGTSNGGSTTFDISCPEIHDPCSNITALTCATPVSVSLPAGVGKFDLKSSTDWLVCEGKEQIFSFTPGVSGTHGIKVTNPPTSYYTTFYFIKDASGGCNGQDWEEMTPNNWPYTTYYSPYPLVAGHTYYIMVDANHNGADVTVEIQCADPYDPCGNISSIGCNTEYSFVNEHGLGRFDPYYATMTTYHFPGKETVYEFTPSISGNYQVELTYADPNTYSAVGYFIKPASSGCNNNNWKWIDNFYYQGQKASMPIALTAGTSYYLLMDSYTAGQTFRLICPSIAFDPCADIVNIASCDQNISATIDAGLGAIEPGLTTPWGPFRTPGREKIFSFTPAQSGAYGLIIEQGGTGRAGYFIKAASSGCNSDGWQYIWEAESWGGAAKIPMMLEAGTTYYILMDGAGTDGATQSFHLTCPPEDPCNNIVPVTCDQMTTVTIPPGINSFNLVPSYSYFLPINGSVRVLSFIAPVRSTYGINVMGNPSGMDLFFFIKDASLGCGPDNWISMKRDYNGRPITPDALIQGHTYYIAMASHWAFSYGDVEFYLICPNSSPGWDQYRDEDGDGFGDPNNAYYGSMWPILGYVIDNSDCNDQLATAHPGATELCGNNIDDDCDGSIDEGCACNLTVTINTSNVAGDFCDGIDLTAVTNGNPSSYSWSNGATTATITLTLADPSGLYSVQITDALGCSGQATYQYNPQDLTSSYTLLGLKNLTLAQSNTVQNGSVGVMSRTGKATIKKNVSIAGPGAFLKAKNMDLQSPYNIPQLIYSQVIADLPAMQYNSTRPERFPNVNVPNNTTITISGNQRNVIIGKNCMVTLQGNIFGNIIIGSGSTLRFTQLSLDIGGIIMANGKSGKVTQLVLSGETELRCNGEIRIGSWCQFNPDNFKVITWLGKINDQPVNFSVDTGGNTTVNSSLYLPSGKLSVGGHATNFTYMNGKFIADEIETKDKNVIWDGYHCGQATPPATRRTGIRAEDAVVKPDGLRVRAFPNPSNDEFTLEIQSNSNAPAELRVYDMYGRVVWSATVNSNRFYRFGSKLARGTYVAELRQGAERSSFKLSKL